MWRDAAGPSRDMAENEDADPCMLWDLHGIFLESL